MLKELIRPYYLRWVYFRLFPGSRPPYFEDCWRYPHQSLEGFEGRLGGHARPAVLWYPMTDWHTRMQRTQHLARELARLGHGGVYVNPHLGRQFPSTPLSGGGHRVSRLEENLVELHVRLPHEPVFHHRMLRAGETRVVVRAMEALLDRLETPAAVQVVSLPVWLDAAVELRRRRGFPVVYDCHDWLGGFSNMAGEIVAAEERLLAAADLVVFSSRMLLERHPQVRHKALLVRNGVEAERFTAAPKHGAKPIVGYVGAIEEWFDVDAVREAALRNPGCRFVLAGRVENPAAGRLAGLPNVEMTGEVPYEQAGRLVEKFQVGLIPFIINPLTMAADPIKLYEYFACGLPVVSSRLAEVEPYGELVYLASDAGEFAEAVGRALAEEDPERRARRVEIANRGSWKERAREMEAALVTLA